MTPEDYEITKKGLLDGSIPKAFEQQAFKEIQEYEAAPHAAPAPAERFSGHEGQMADVAPQPKPEFSGHESQSADTYGAYLPEGQPTQPRDSSGARLAEMTPSGLPMTDEQAHAHWMQSLKQPNLKSASKMPDIYRPPVHMARKPMGYGVAGADVITDATNALQSAREALPQAMGGSVQSYTEPSLDDFRAKMFPAFGQRVYQMGLDSDQYKQFADIQWKNEHDAAEHEGRSIVRHAFSSPQNEGFRQGVDTASAMGQTAVENIPIAGPVGAWTADAIGQTSDAVENRRRLTSQNPGSALTGELAGSLLLPVPKATAGSFAGRMVQHAAGGAGTGAAITGAEDYFGASPGTRKSASDIGLDMVHSGIGGGFVGGGLGLVAEGARALRPYGVLLDRARDVEGTDTSFTKGMTRGPEMDRLKAEVKGMGGLPEEEIPHAIEKNRPAVTESVLGEEARANLQHGANLDQSHEALARHMQPAQELFDAVHEIDSKQYSADGKPVNDLGAQQIRKIKKLVSQVTPQDTRRELVKVVEPGEDHLRTRTIMEYGPGAPAEIKKRYWADRAKKFDAEATDLRTPASTEATTNPGGRPTKAGPGETEVPTATGEHPSIRGTDVEMGMNLDKPQKLTAEEEDMAIASGEAATPMNAAKYELKRVQSKGAGKAVVLTPERSKLLRLPEVTDTVTAKSARQLGIPVPPDVPDDGFVIIRKTMEKPATGAPGMPSAAKDMEGHQARAQGYDVPENVGDHDLVYVTPRRLSPGELHEMETGIHQLTETGAVPGIDKIERAAKKVRDAYPEAGPATGARASIKDRGTGQTSELRGLSALQHNASEDIATKALTRKRTGVLTDAEAKGTGGRDPIDPAPAFRNATMGKGQSPAEVADRKAAWERAGKGDAYKFIEGLKAYQELSGKKLSYSMMSPFRPIRDLLNPSEMNAISLHLDPVFAGKYAPSAGRLGGVAGAQTRRPAVQKLPPLDYINSLLNPNPTGQ